LPELRAGERLRLIRSRLGLTTREVADLSRKIAATESNEEFALSHARLTQIENDGTAPSLYKLFTLAAVYGLSFTEIASLYLDLDAISTHQLSMRSENTRLANFDTYNNQSGQLSGPLRSWLQSRKDQLGFPHGGSLGGGADRHPPTTEFS